MGGFPSVKKGNRLAEKAKRPLKGVPLNKNTILDLIVKTHGNLSRIADAMGSTRTSIRTKINSCPVLQEALLSSRERIIDQLEESVWDRAIESKDTTLQLFLLKTQAKHRGYEQDEAKNSAKDIATAAFDFIVKKQSESQ